MALMDAKEYDPRPARRIKRILGTSAAVITVLLVFWFWPSGRFRYHKQWNIANKFLDAIERRDFDSAYGLYNGDPDWKLHPEKYKYTLVQFTSDWGPAGDYGVITAHHVDCVIEPPKIGSGPVSGVVVTVMVNRQTDPALLWIEKKSNTITTSPWDLSFLTHNSPLVRAFCVKRG